MPWTPPILKQCSLTFSLHPQSYMSTNRRRRRLLLAKKLYGTRILQKRAILKRDNMLLGSLLHKYITNKKFDHTFLPSLFNICNKKYDCYLLLSIFTRTFQISETSTSYRLSYTNTLQSHCQYYLLLSLLYNILQQRSAISNRDISLESICKWWCISDSTKQSYPS